MNDGIFFNFVVGKVLLLVVSPDPSSVVMYRGSTQKKPDQGIVFIVII